MFSETYGRFPAMLVETTPDIFDKTLEQLAPKNLVFYRKVSEQFPAVIVETEHKLFDQM